MAAAQLCRERPDYTLQTSALVHEAYLRLVHQKQVRWQTRAHFYGIAQLELLFLSLPRHLSLIRAAMPVNFGVDAKSKAAAVAFAVDHNNLGLLGGNLDFTDLVSIWDEEGGWERRHLAGSECSVATTGTDSRQAPTGLGARANATAAVPGTSVTRVH